MIMLIDHIDKIARDLKRDVVWIAFQDKSNILGRNYDWDKENSPRHKITQWLDVNNIEWKPCAWPSQEGVLISSYDGEIYIDIPFDTNNEKFRLLSAYLEDENGQVKSEFSNTQFYATTLEVAMKNAHHDDPEFWDKLSDNP